MGQDRSSHRQGKAEQGADSAQSRQGVWQENKHSNRTCAKTPYNPPKSSAAYPLLKPQPNGGSLVHKLGNFKALEAISKLYERPRFSHSSLSLPLNKQKPNTAMKFAATTATLTLVALAALAGCSQGPSEEELARLAALEAQIEEQEARAEREAQRAAELAEAKRLAEEAAEKAAEAEAARRAELAAQVEREKAEKARLASQLQQLNQRAETLAESRQELEAQLAQARQEREAAAREAEQKLSQAQRQLAQAEASKAAEIQAAREAAIAEATTRMEERARSVGRTAPTEVVTDRRQERPSAFVEVEIAERNYRNNTRRVTQRRLAED